MRRLAGTCLLIVAGISCSSQPSAPAGPPPTPTPTIRPLPEPVQQKVREVYPTLARELSLTPAQEPRVRTYLEGTLGRVYSLTVVPLTSEKGRQQMIKLSLDQFENDLLGILTDAQLPLWDSIRGSTRRSMSRIVFVPVPAATPPPPRGL